MESVDFVTNHLRDLRSMDDDEWTSKEYGAYTMANKLANAIEVQLCIPRLAARQIHRNSVAANNAVDYFKRAIWYP